MSTRAPVRSSTQYLRLTPRDTTRQKVLDWKLDTPGQALRTTDGYGNVLHVLTIDKPVSEIAIHAEGTVETSSTLDEPSDFTGVPLSPLLFLRRGGVYLTPGLNFRQLLEKGFEGKPAVQADWVDHLSTLFPEVRIKRVMEVRGADCVSPWITVMSSNGTPSASDAIWLHAVACPWPCGLVPVSTPTV